MSVRCASWLLVVLLAPLAAAQPAEPKDPPLALVGAKLIARPGATPVEGATVIVRDGRIEAVGTGLPLPFDARGVDCAGLTLTYGLLDAGDERDLPFPAAVAQQGRPFADGRDVEVAMPLANRLGLAPERRVADSLPQDAAARDAQRKAGFAATLVAPRGQALSGFASWLALSGRPPREALLGGDDAAQFGSLEWRAGFDSDTGDRYPSTLMGLMADLRQVLLDAQWQAALRTRHAHDDPPWRGVADESLRALEPVLSGAVPLVLHARQKEDVHLALGLADAFPGLHVVIAGGLEAWHEADDLARHHVGVIHDLDFGKEPEDPDAVKDDAAKPGNEASKPGEQDKPHAHGAGRNRDATNLTDAPKPHDEPGDEDATAAQDAGQGKDAAPDKDTSKDKPAATGPWDVKPPLAARRDTRRRWLENVRGVAELRKHGVTVAFGSLGRDPDKLLGDLRVAIDKGGLSDEDALAGLTTAAASLLGGRGPHGEIAAGAPALLVAWHGDPLAKTARPALLVVDGVLFDRRVDAADEVAKASKDESKKPGGEEQPAAKGESAKGEAAKPEGAGAAAPAAPAVEWPVELDSDRQPSFHTGGDVLVTHATVLTATHGTLEDTDVLVRGGRFAEIGHGLAAPEGVHVVDATGHWVMPGVIDCHSHTGIRGGINEGSRVVTPEVTIEDEVDPEDVNLYRALAGGVTAARLLHGSANAIGGRHEVIKLRWGEEAPGLVFAGAPRGVKFALGENPKQSNFDGSTRFPHTRMGVEATIRRAFEAGTEYRDEWTAYRSRVAAGENPDPPRRDLRLEALAGILDGSIKVHSHCYESDEILMLIRTCEEFGVHIATLQHVLEGYKIAPEIAAAGIGGSTFADWWGYKFEVVDATPYNAALMSEAGVCTSINSDSDEHLRRLYLEAAKGIHYGGMAEQDALKLVTLNPAIQLGIADRTGSIDVGKDADFAIYSLHPFDVRTQVLMTFVDGELRFERREGRYDAWVAELGKRIADGKAAAAAAPAAPGEVEARARNVPADALAALRLPRDANKAPSNPSRPAPQAVALVGGTVHTMETRDGALVTYSPGTVLMEGGKLRGVYAGAASPPDGFRVVDVSGLQVWPGFIDAGCTVGLQEVESVAGSMDVREIGEDQPDLRASVAWHADSAHIPVTRVNGTTTALVVPQGGRVAGQSSAMALEGWTAADALVKDAVALHVIAPRTARKTGDEDQPTLLGEPWQDQCDDTAFERPRGARGRGRSAGPTEGDLATRVRQAWQPLRDMFEAAREHARVAGEAARRGVPGPEWEPRLQALAPYALGQAPVVFHADWADQIADALDFAKEQGLKPIIAGGQQAWKVADRLALADAPVLLGPVLSLPAEDDEPYDAPLVNAGLLHRLGVRFCFRSNESSSARDLPYHVGMAVAFGLPEDDALRALTADAAAILGLPDVGTLTPGKRADVIVTDGDPLQIRSSMKYVFIGGRDVGLETHHTLLYEKYEKRLHDPGTPNGP